MSGRTVVTRRPDTGELLVERAFAAPPAVVWRCWTTPEVANWWGPRGWTAVVHEMDVRPGGTWRYSLVPEVGDDPPVHCIAAYDRVEPPAILGFVDRFADDGWTVVPGSDMPTVVRLHPLDRGTWLSVTTRFADAAGLARAEELGLAAGLAAALDRLGEHLAGPALAPDDPPRP